MIDVHRAGAEVLGVPWEKCDVVWGNTTKNLPFTCVSGGSQTTHAMTRAAHAAAMDARKKLQEIAAKTLGRGNPEDYEVAGERVFHKDGGAGLTFAQAAQRAIELGGIYDGHEVPADVHPLTKASVAALAGQGLWRPRATSTRATARRFPMSPASPKSKSMSKPASITFWIFSPTPMSAP